MAVPAADPPTVMNIASIQFKKGTDLFVDVALRVCQQHPTVEFVWLGSGRPFGDYMQKLADTGLQDRVLFPGHVEPPSLLLRRASIFFLASREDSFPLSLLEAMCLGRRVVAFNAGGAPEALAGLGSLIAPFDTEAAADEILRLLEQPRALDLDARQRFLEHFTPERAAERLNRAIRQALTPHP